MNSRERFFALLDDRPIDHLVFMPITMMFAAHHIGEKYGKYALDHRIMANAQIRLAKDYNIDHVSVITETREAPDCGAKVRFFDDQPYVIDESSLLLNDKSILVKLKCPSPYHSRYMCDRLDGIVYLKKEVGDEKIIEGWVEGPCAAAADIRGLQALMMDFYEDARFVGELLEFVLELAVDFGKAQIEAGADVIGIGDAAASLIGPQLYNEYVWPMEKRLIEALHKAGAKIRLHICGDIRHILEPIDRLGCEIIDIDSMVPMSEARAKTDPKTCLLGGVDPVSVLQNGTPQEILDEITKCHRQAGPQYIVGAGCEVTPGTLPANLRVLADYAHNAGREGHRGVYRTSPGLNR